METFRAPLINRSLLQSKREKYLLPPLLFIFFQSSPTLFIPPKATSLPSCPPAKHRWDKEKGSQTEARERETRLLSAGVHRIGPTRGSASHFQTGHPNLESSCTQDVIPNQTISKLLRRRPVNEITDLGIILWMGPKNVFRKKGRFQKAPTSDRGQTQLDEQRGLGKLNNLQSSKSESDGMTTHCCAAKGTFNLICITAAKRKAMF